MTYCGPLEVIGRGYPLELVPQFAEGICKAPDVTCAVVEEVEAHGGGCKLVRRGNGRRAVPWWTFWKRFEEGRSRLRVTV